MGRLQCLGIAMTGRATRFKHTTQAPGKRQAVISSQEAGPATNTKGQYSICRKLHQALPKKMTRHFEVAINNPLASEAIHGLRLRSEFREEQVPRSL